MTMLFEPMPRVPVPHGGPTQVADVERWGRGPVAQTKGRTSAAASGTLPRSAAPCRIIFLDIDGVLAPRINAGQLARQCVEGVAALCRLTGARVVLTSAWRKLEGKTEIVEDVLRSHHASDVLYDVTPDLYGKLGSMEDLPAVDPSRFVLVDARKGLTFETASAALAILGTTDESARAGLRDVFTDPDYESDVFSELSRQYGRASFSPRQSMDFNLDPCCFEFACTRSQEIFAWLGLAAEAGVRVSHWVILDDDNLLCKRPSSALEALPCRSVPAEPYDPAADDGGDDPWAFTF